MPPFRTVDVRFPAGGLNKLFAYQQQEPFSSASLSNVRTEGPLEGRHRGGSRPGLVKAFDTRIGSGNPIRMLTVMRTLSGESRLVFSDNFTDGDISNWTAVDAAWLPLAQDGGLLGINNQFRGIGLDDRASLLNDGVLTNFENANNLIQSPYSIEINVQSSDIGIDQIRNTFVYARMDDSNPTPVSSIDIQYQEDTRTPGSYGVALTAHVNGSFVGILGTQNTGGDIPIADLHLILTVDGTKARGELIPGVTTNINAMSGEFIIPEQLANHSRMALRVDHSESNTKPILDDFVVRYFDASGGIPPESVVAASKHAGTNGQTGANVWYETNKGDMQEVVSDRDGSSGVGEVLTDLNDTVHLIAADRLGKLYIADHGVRHEGTDGTLDAAGTLFHDGATDWTETTATTGVDVDGDWVEILSTGSGENATVGVYKPTAASSSGITLDTSAGTTETGIKFRVLRGAKVFEPTNSTSANRLTRWEATAAKGNVPVGCTTIEVYRDRMVMGGDPENPGVWYMSRQGDPNDWLFGDIDAQAAVAGTSTTSDAGELPIPISAIASVGQDYMYISAESEIYVMRGDPMQGGVLDNISRQIGVGSRSAYCRTPDGGIVFLARDGLYSIRPSLTISVPESLSIEKLPRDLLNLVQNTDNNVMMEYDVRDQGIHLFITPSTVGPVVHWWYDWLTKGFFPIRTNSDHEPFSIVFQAKENHVVLGCRDGFLRRFDSASSVDDGIEFNSEALYGPFRLGGSPVFNGNVASLSFVLDENSGDVDWEIFVGDSAQNAFNAGVFDSGTVSAGRNASFRPRAGGHSAYLKLKNNTNERWAVESIQMILERTGPTRVH